MEDVAGGTGGDIRSKSIRKIEADSGTLIHREKPEKSGNGDWGPTRVLECQKKEGLPTQVTTTQRCWDVPREP